MLDQHAALVEAEFHNASDEVGLCDDGGADIGLLDVLDEHQVGHARRIVNFGLYAVLVEDLVGNVGYGGDDVHIEFTTQSLLDDFHMEQAQEAAAEAEAERQ